MNILNEDITPVLIKSFMEIFSLDIEGHFKYYEINMLLEWYYQEIRPTYTTSFFYFKANRQKSILVNFTFLV